MSFPPTLGITTSFLIDPTGSLLIQDFPSLLPQLEHICSPFSKHRMNGYSRIKKHASARSKSVDFADLSLTHHTPAAARNLKSHETRLNLKITTMHDSIPEEDTGEVFGIILTRKCSVSSDQKVPGPVQESAKKLQKAVESRPFPVQRSASVSESYSRIHHQSDIDTAAEEDEISYLNTNSRRKKKKGKFLRVFKRLFGL